MDSTFGPEVAFVRAPPAANASSATSAQGRPTRADSNASDARRTTSTASAAAHGISSTPRVVSLAALAANGRLRVHVSRELPMTEAPEAHRLIAEGHVRGKLVLTGLE